MNSQFLMKMIDKDLDNIIYNMLLEMSSEADYRNCFIETDVTALDSDRSW